MNTWNFGDVSVAERHGFGKWPANRVYVSVRERISAGAKSDVDYIICLFSFLHDLLFKEGFQGPTNKGLI